LIVGIGVGTIGVTMTTMAAEYAPRRFGHFAVGFVQAGWPLGSIATALVAVRTLPTQGWPNFIPPIFATPGWVGHWVLVVWARFWARSSAVFW
jgi:hypothetical protein